MRVTIDTNQLVCALMRPPELEMLDLPHIPPVCRDPDDDKVVATAVFGSVDYLVTADKDLRARPVVELLGREGIWLTTIDDLMILL